ncbi:unnamed protein product, partial [Heterobilharzia americana]
MVLLFSIDLPIITLLVNDQTRIERGFDKLYLNAWELKFICSTGDYKTVTSTFCIRRRCYNVATNSSDLTLISYHNHRLWAWNAESWNGYSPLSIP